MFKGLGQGEGFSCTWDLSARLPEEVGSGAVFPLREMDTYLVRQYPGSPDELLCGLHQSDDNPTPDISARPLVVLPPLCCKATG